MDITLTIHITEKQLPELIGLLAKMWVNPDPTGNIEIQEEPAKKTVRIIKEETQEAQAPFTANMTAPVAPPAPVGTTMQETPGTPGAAQIQAAAGAFMAIDPINNINVLQTIMREFGVSAFPELKEDQFPAFVKRLRELGVKV